MNVSIKRAVVTGGAGFIGSHLVDALLEMGCEITVLDNLSTGNIENLKNVRERIHFIEGDIRDSELVTRICQGSQVIFHQAAVVSVPQTVKDPIGSIQVNELGTLAVLEAARKNRVPKVVLASSCAVYGDGPEMPKRESLVPVPQTPYAIQKLASEHYARIYSELHGIHTICLRYFNVFGPRQDPSSPYSGVISIFMTRAAAGKKASIYGDGKQSRDFIYVNDVVRANLFAAGMGEKSGIYNVGTGRSVEISRLWEMVCRLAGKDPAVKFCPPRPGDIRASVADIRRFSEASGFVPDFDFEQGLQQTYQWYRLSTPC